MDVGAWLRERGLGQYEQVFRDNDVDARVLPGLTAEDLKDIGVVSVGHRRLILQAIAGLSAPPTPGAPAPVTTETVTPKATAEPPQTERRQLTVMFVDLVGSTALSTRLDPEDLRAVIGGYHRCCAGVIGPSGGYIAKYMGDGVLAYFGYPEAHEDDVERAVRSGLALTGAVGGLAVPPGYTPQVRVGIATGLVVVGDLVGAGDAQERGAVGETPNLAARLQALAEPGQVVIAAGTRRLLGGLFDYRDLGPQVLKGFAEPVTAWHVLGASAVESRFEARHEGGLTPLVGREEEMELLLRCWRRVRDGEGQVVFLSGEAGIGKSRLSRAFEERLAGETHAGLRYFCSPHHQDSALYPFTAQLERAAGFTRADAPRERFARLEGLLARSDAEAEEVGLIAELLSLPSDGRHRLPEMSPQRRKEKTLAALLAQLAGLAARRPVLMLFEDAHWIDPTSLELLGLAVERVARLPVLLLITARPEFAPPWPRYAHVTAPSLTRLSRREGAALVGRVTGGKAVPAEVMEQILDRTDGVPLFVEELTKTVLESGLLHETDGGYVLTGSFQPLAIPTTLHASLAARLGRLAPAREVAQVGAVIGREFSHELLAAVAPMSASLLGDALEQLVDSELVFRRGAPPDAVYTFKHALVQDAAYQSLLKSKRQRLHARIAEVLEERSPDVGETGPEVLAQHLTDAGLAERAIPYWRRAGELAAGRSADLEAIAHLGKGLELVGTLPNAPEHLDEELALHLAIGGPLLATKGYAAPEVERTYSRAWALCDQLGRSAELFAVLRGLWNCYLVRGEFQRAHDLAERLVALAEEQGAPLRRALAERARGTTLFFFGRFADATAALDEGIAIDDAIGAWEERRADLLLHTERAAVACRLYSAEALWFLGFPDSARERIESGLALAQRLAHVNSLAFALTWAAILHNLRREFAEAQGRAEAAIEIAGRHRMSAWLGHASVCRGFALAGLGHQTAGIAQLRTGLAAWNATGGHLLDTQWLGFLADAHLQAGQLDDALSALDQAADTATATGECHYQAELYRLRGTVLAEIGEPGENAEAALWLRRAIDTAQTQQAKSLELRAATSLARLWADQGRRVEAYELLAPIHGWFTEGLDTPDLKDARMLLDGLASTPRAAAQMLSRRSGE